MPQQCRAMVNISSFHQMWNRQPLQLSLQVHREVTTSLCESITQVPDGIHRKFSISQTWWYKSSRVTVHWSPGCGQLSESQSTGVQVVTSSHSHSPTPGTYYSWILHSTQRTVPASHATSSVSCHQATLFACTLLCTFH